MMAASIINTDLIRKPLAQAVLTVLGLRGVATLFLPFIFGNVPVEVFLEDSEKLNLFWLTLLGPFVVLPFFISAGYLRWLFTGGLSRWEGGLGYALALIVVFLLSVVIIQEWWESGFDDDGMWLIFAFLTLGLGAGAWFVIQNLRHGVPLTLTALVALQLAYLPFALFWLLFPIDDLIGGGASISDVSISDVSIGAYLAFLTVLVYTAQAALSVLGQRRVLLRLLPLSLIWVLPVALFVWEWIEG